MDRAKLEVVDGARYIVAKASGSRFAYVIDTHRGGTIKRYDILKGQGRANGWECAKRHASELNLRADAADTTAGEAAQS